MNGDEKVAYHDVLEADENGHTPDSPAFNVKSQSSTELIGKHELEVSQQLKVTWGYVFNYYLFDSTC